MVSYKIKLTWYLILSYDEKNTSRIALFNCFSLFVYILWTENRAKLNKKAESGVSIFD